MRKFFLSLSFVCILLVAPVFAKGLSLKQIKSLKSLGYSNQDLIEVVKKKKVTFSLSPAQKKELKSQGFSESLIEAIDTNVLLTLEEVLRLSKEKTDTLELVKKIRQAGLQVKADSDNISRLVKANASPAVIYALTHKEGSMTFEELKKLALKKVSAETLFYLASEVKPPMKLSAYQAAELIQAGVPMETVKKLRDLSYIRNEEFGYKIEFPSQWKTDINKLGGGQASLLRGEAPESDLIIKIRAEKAKQAIDFSSEGGRKVFQKIISKFQNNILAQQFHAISQIQVKVKGKRSAFISTDLNGHKAIRCRYNAKLQGGTPVEITAYYLSTSKGLYILWGIYTKAGAEKGRKKCDKILSTFTPLGGKTK